MTNRHGTELRSVLLSAIACIFCSGMIVGFMAGPIIAMAAAIAGATLVGVGYGLVKFNEWRERKLIARIRQEVLMDANERKLNETLVAMEHVVRDKEAK